MVPGGEQILPFAPMDDLMSLWGIQDLMLDFVDRPALIHQAMDKIVSCYLDRLRQMTALNLLALNSNAAGAITQGMGECFTAELPGPDCNPAAVQPRDMWGGATAQILAAVSPAMHDEFALRHERRWLDQFGLTAYGCCEPLHQKVGILRQIKNLRKISMSSWIRPDEAAARGGRPNLVSY